MHQRLALGMCWKYDNIVQDQLMSKNHQLIAIMLISRFGVASIFRGRTLARPFGLGCRMARNSLFTRLFFT
jgi:hypothetical protein